MAGDVDEIMREVRKGLESLYGSRLKGLYLYGSYARGQQDTESDVDVLIVLDGTGDYSAEIHRTSFLTSTLSLAHGVSISGVFLSEEQWSSSESAFVGSVREEAVPA